MGHGGLRKGGWRNWWLVWCCLLWHALAQASPMAVSMLSHPDTSGLLNAQEALDLPAAAWTTESAAHASLGYTQHPVWFRIRATQVTQLTVDAVLEVGYPLLGEIQLYRIQDGGRSVSPPQLLGANLPFAQRPVLHRNFVIPVSLAPGEVVEWLVRVRTESSLQMPVTLHARSDFDRDEQFELLFHGCYAGAAAAMLIYNLFLLLLLRDESYLWYLGWMLGIAGTILTLNGLTFQWLWPGSPQWNMTSIPVQLSFAAVFAGQFFCSFVHLKQASLRAWRLTCWLMGLNGLVGVSAFFVRYQVAILASVGITAVSLLMVLTQAALLTRRGNTHARMYLVNFSLVVAGGLVLAASRLGWLPRTPWTEYAPQVGSAVEILLFAVALAARVNAERRLREHAQHDLIRHQEQKNRELEDRVAQRTADLTRLNASLQDMSRTDALTGVANRRHLEQVMAQTQGHSTAVLMIDIDHFKRVNDNWGHAAGDACLKQVAQRLQEGLRSATDLVARYGGEEFAVLLPGLSLAQALDQAEAARQRVAANPVRFGDDLIAITASLGVAVGTWTDQAGGEALIRLADDGLYAAKAAGRNQVVAIQVPAIAGH